MIITCRKRIPFSWIMLAVLPWAAIAFVNQMMQTGFIFSLKKFVDNPAAVSFVLSLPTIIGLVVAPLCTFTSDRIWTRWGRRKPFVVVGWIGKALCVGAMPFMPGIWSLVGAYILVSLFSAIQDPIIPLKVEIIPPRQRGVAVAAMSWMTTAAHIVFSLVALGRFDDVTYFSGLRLTGETAIYLAGMAIMVVLIQFVIFGIKELDQRSPLRGERWSLRNLLGGLLHADLWPVYILVFSASLAVGLGPLSNLLQSEQFGFTKQMIGVNITVGGVLNLFLIALLGLFADRLPRLKAYVVLSCIALALKLAFFCYVEYLLPDKRASLVEVILFGETLAVVGILTQLVYQPMVLDYIRRNQLGTFQAGQGLFQRGVGVLALNGVGLFVSFYSAMFQPPAGEMVRVALRDEADQAVVEERLAAHRWSKPQDGTPVAASEVSCASWSADGMIGHRGRGWEIRLHDAGSAVVAERKSGLESERSEAKAEESLVRYSLGQEGDSAEEQARLAALQTRLGALDAEIAGLAEQLDAAAEAFHVQVAEALVDLLPVPGDQYSAAILHQAMVIEWPQTRRPDSRRLERVLTRLKEVHPEVIDLRCLKRDGGFILSLSILVPPGADSATLSADLVAGVLLAEREAGLVVAATTTAPVVRWQQAVELEAQIVEQPLDDRISPVTAVVNGILAWFDAAPAVDRRIGATARNLRLAGGTEHVRIRPSRSGDRAINAVAVLPLDEAPTLALDDPIGVRLGSLLGENADPVDVARVYAFAVRLERAAAGQQVTLLKPLVGRSFARMQYDYMSGYLWMFILGLIGLGITVLFVRRVARGGVHTVGLDEAALTAPEHTDQPHDGPQGTETRSTEYYVPGHTRTKLALAMIGGFVFVYGLSTLWQPLRLTLVGEHAVAEAVHVVKVESGQPDRILSDGAQVRKASESHNRNPVFWNVFDFEDAHGTRHAVRCPVGGLLQPLYPLLDDEGLPTTVTVAFDPAKPEQIVFPTAYSTWFVPGMIAGTGLMMAMIGLVMWWRSMTPIEVPRIHFDETSRFTQKT